MQASPEDISVDLDELTEPDAPSPARAGTRKLDMEPILREKIAHYVLEQQLGEGALGEVFRARDTKLNRTVALKVLSDAVEDQALRDRFHLEARAIAALKHPNVVQVLDYSDANAHPQYIALEALSGRSLQALVDQYGPIDEQTALCIGREVASGLHHAHSQTIVHRDVKPDNVVLEFGRVVLIDFGAMKVASDHETVPSSAKQDALHVVGTPGFMAPEQFGNNVDHRADVFGLGALLYYVTTGHVPYEPDRTNLKSLQRSARRDRYEDPRSLQPLLTPAFCDLLADCLAPSPSDRLDSAAKARERIERLINGHGVRDVNKVVELYTQDPSQTLRHDLRSASKLQHDLRIALMRDFQEAIRLDDIRRITEATIRLREFSTFEEKSKLQTHDRRRKPKLLKGRRRRRMPWIMAGLLFGLLAATGLLLALPVSYQRIQSLVAPFLP